MKKKGISSFLKGVGLAARMNEIQFVVMTQRAIDEGSFKADGFASVQDFVKAVTGGGSYDVFHERSSRLKRLGAEITGIMVSLGWGMRDIRMIEHAIADDGTGKKVLKIEDGKTIPFSEDRLDELQSHFDIIKEKGKLAEKKLASIDKEHKKEVKAMNAEIDSLKAQMINPDTPEAFNELFTTVERLATQIVIAAKRLKFDEAHKDADADGPIKAKYEVRIRVIETQFTNLIDALREAIYGAK